MSTSKDRWLFPRKRPRLSRGHTLLIPVNPQVVQCDDLATLAETRGLTRKPEFHITILGYRSARKLSRALQRSGIASDVRSLIGRASWRFRFRPERYFVEKAYGETGGDPERRQSIVQFVEVNGLEDFFSDLSTMTGVELEPAFPHVTLFAGSTSPAMQTQGIGIYSQAEFDALSPEPLSNEGQT